MKTRKYLIFTLLASVFLATPFVAKAGEIKVRDDVIIQKERIVNDNVYAAARNVNVEGTINGDLIVMSDNVQVSGKIKGDLLGVTSNLNITGEVEGNVRAMAQSVNITGKIGRNANLMTQDTNIGENGSIAWDLIFLSESVNIAGSVGKDLQGSATRLEVSGSVGSDIKAKLKATAGKEPLIVKNDANIGGNIFYRSDIKGNISEDANVAGVIEYGEYESGSQAVASWFSELIYSLFGALLIGLVLVTLGRNKLNTLFELLRDRPEFAALKGVGILVLIPAATILLFFTIIGIPLALILLALWVVFLVLSRVIVAIFIGQWLVNKTNWKNKSLMLSMVIGVVLSWIAFSIPVFGWVLSLAAIVLGLGVLYNYFRLP